MARLVTRGGRRIAPAKLSTGDLAAVCLHGARGTRGESGYQAPSVLSQGVVTSLEEMSVEITCDEPIEEGVVGLLYAVVKVTSDVTHKRYTKALDFLQNASTDTQHVAFNLTQVLLSGANPRFHNSTQIGEKLELCMSSLNCDQREAVVKALSAKDLAVIHGPPGTGKTHTLIAYINAEVQRGSRVLVVAPSNVAVDNLAERLAHVRPLPKFVRSGHSARIIPSVIPFSFEAQMRRTDDARLAEDIRIELNELGNNARKTSERATRKRLRVEQRQLRKELRQREKVGMVRLLGQMQVVLATISGAGARLLDIAEGTSPFDVVVIDEAAQALEAACWVPLLRGKKAVFAGDPYQLAGTVKSVEAEAQGLKKSILDRVFRSELLKQTVCMLKIQYRMNAVISSWSSEEFYDGELVADPSVADHKIADLVTVKAGNSRDDEKFTEPFIIIDTAGGDCEEDASSSNGQVATDIKSRTSSALSRSNQGEAKIICQVVDEYLAHGVAKHDLAVISPYSGQVELLRKLLWPKHGRAIEIATIDSFQGREKEIVCMSLVRSNEAGEVGFLSDNRRMNVAITRARRCVVVVCDSETISSDAFLGRIVEFAEAHGLYRSAVVDFPHIIGTVSQLRKPKEALEAERRAGCKGGRPHTKSSGHTFKRSPPRRTNRSHESRNIDVAIKNMDMRSDEDMRGSLKAEMKNFLADDNAAEKEFSSDLSAYERRLVHEIAEELKLLHESSQVGQDRFIRVWKSHPASGSNSEDSMHDGSGGVARQNSSDAPGTTGRRVEHGRQSDLEAVDDGTLNKSDNTPSAEYRGINSLLEDANLNRQRRLQSAMPEAHRLETSNDKASHVRKKSKRKKKKKTEDSDDDFDAILAKYGAGSEAEVPTASAFSGPVAQIVNGKLTSAATPRTHPQHTFAKKKLADKLAAEAERRKRKPKS